MKRLSIALISLIVLSACSTTHPLEKRVNKDNFQTVTVEPSAELTSKSQAQAEPLRFWANQQPEFLLSENNTTPLKVNGERLNFLALSGGGADGAYGAGALVGLHDQQQLPEFTIITGISAGALIAPFVFAGEDQDFEALKAAMLSITDDKILGKKNILNVLFKDAFAKKESLLTLIQETYTSDMIERIAQQHQQGRRLFIGTTHFDSGEQITWNIGAIAASDLVNRQALIHQVLAASASIPGVFPPQFVEVYQQGEKFEELHVDGGLSYQMFFDPSGYDYSKVSKALGLTEKPKVYVIRNGELSNDYQPVPDKSVGLISRSVHSLILRQARGDYYRMMYMSQKNNFEIALTYIDTDFVSYKKPKVMFDTQHIYNLYQHAYRKAQRGELWVSELPN